MWKIRPEAASRFSGFTVEHCLTGLRSVYSSQAVVWLFGLLFTADKSPASAKLGVK